MKIKTVLGEVEGGCVEGDDVIRHARLMQMHL